MKAILKLLKGLMGGSPLISVKQVNVQAFNDLRRGLRQQIETSASDFVRVVVILGLLIILAKSVLK